MKMSGKVYHMISRFHYSLQDVATCLQTATSIHKVEVDELASSQDGFKYTIYGRATNGSPFYACGKLLLNEKNERFFFVITAHERTDHK
jgi:hypothetical protein